MTEACAVVVNWNGWRDTIVCIESLLQQEDARLSVLVCDNGSSDGSAGELECWMRRRLSGWTQVQEDSRETETTFMNPDTAAAVRRVRVLRLGRNLGYAGGANAGIRWAQAHWQAGDFWILNNDIRAGARALRALVDAHAQVPEAGLCGSVLLEWDSEEVQAVGGLYLPWLAVGKPLRHTPPGAPDAFVGIDYPVGASLYAKREYLQRVGLMEESFFLYYEELDWVERGRRHGLHPVVALNSRLWHKEGASTGSRGTRRKSMLSEHYGVVNRLRVTRRFWPHLLPLVWLSLGLVTADRLAHREFARALLVLRLMFSPKAWW